MKQLKLALLKYALKVKAKENLHFHCILCKADSDNFPKQENKLEHKMHVLTAK